MGGPIRHVNFTTLVKHLKSLKSIEGLKSIQYFQAAATKVMRFLGVVLHSYKSLYNVQNLKLSNRSPQELFKCYSIYKFQQELVYCPHIGKPMSCILIK